MSKISIKGNQFVDELGRTLLLRGVNLGGSSKVPVDFPTHKYYGFYNNKFSFIGRPFPLKEADRHFERLKKWGFYFLRFIVTWEAIEPLKPGHYDEDYLEYIYQIIKKAQSHGIKVFIDPHQDVWSRFSGGDGAPRWTFEKVGLNPERFSDSEAAILHQGEKDNLEEMIWPTNYTKFATATMFTLFFGGNDFAPDLKVEDQNIQDYLQNHYINALKALAEKIKDLDNVVGFDTMNEPSPGWIGWQDLNSNAFIYQRGKCPSPFQSMVMASGKPLQIDFFKFGSKGAKRRGTVDGNSRGVKVWLNGFTCFWKQLGIWDFAEGGEAVLHKPHYFSEVKGKKVNFNQDYLLPFIKKFTKEIREVIPKALIFTEFPPFGEEKPQIEAGKIKNLVYAGHWYDAMTLFRKKFSSWFGYNVEKRKVIFGKKRVRRYFAEQLENIKKESEVKLGNIPTLIGEIGIPFDMNRKKAYKTGDFTAQEKALDANLQALEANFLSFTLWNYTADNTNDHGDMWNKEDLSIFSKSQQTDPQDIHSGGRALSALLRPYPICTAGTPIKMNFNYKKGIFEYEFEHIDSIKAATEIYVPQFHFPNGYKVQISDGNYEIDEKQQKLIYYHSVDRFRHDIRISKSSN